MKSNKKNIYKFISHQYLGELEIEVNKLHNEYELVNITSIITQGNYTYFTAALKLKETQSSMPKIETK